MLSNVAVEQAFEWAERLTCQSDFNSLTNEMVAILESLCGVQLVAVYEVFGGRQVKTNESGSFVWKRLFVVFQLIFPSKNTAMSMQIY